MKKLLWLLFCVPVFGQINARMLSQPNVVTASTYVFVAADATRITAFNRGSSIAATLFAGTALGFQSGTLFSVQNVGAGTLTITCSGCLIFASGTSGASTLVLAQGAGADIYSAGLNYYAQTGSGSGGGGCSGSCVNSVFGRGGPTITQNAADYSHVGIVQAIGNTDTLNLQTNNASDMFIGNQLNSISLFHAASNIGVQIQDATNDAIYGGAILGSQGWKLAVDGAGAQASPTLTMNLTDIIMTTDGVTNHFDLGATGLNIGVPITVPGCTGCAGLTLSTDQFVIGAAPASTVNVTAPQGALAYDTVANSGPALRAMTDADIAQGATGTTGSAFVLADQPTFTTNATTPKLTLAGTGPTEWDFTYQTTPNAPTSNVSKMAMFVNNFVEFSQNGFAYSSTPIVMQTAADFNTSSTTPAAVTGLTSPSIGAGQTVQFSCTGIYQFATGLTKMLSRVVATQTPQKIWYWVRTDSNTTGGASQRQTAVANNTTITPGSNVGAITTNYGFDIGGYIQWNASTAGTFTIQAATNAGADQLTIAQGANCTVTVQ